MSANSLKELLDLYLDKDPSDIPPSRIPNCYICEDKGLIEYRKIIGGFPYRYYAHCTCEQGEKYIYEGNQCSQKSAYRMPEIDEVLTPSMLMELKKENENRYAKWKNKGHRCKYVREEDKERKSCEYGMSMGN